MGCCIVFSAARIFPDERELFFLPIFTEQVVFGGGGEMAKKGPSEICNIRLFFVSTRTVVDKTIADIAPLCELNKQKEKKKKDDRVVGGVG